MVSLSSARPVFTLTVLKAGSITRILLGYNGKFCFIQKGELCMQYKSPPGEGTQTLMISSTTSLKQCDVWKVMVDPESEGCLGLRLLHRHSVLHSKMGPNAMTKWNKKPQTLFKTCILTKTEKLLTNRIRYMYIIYLTYCRHG